MADSQSDAEVLAVLEQAAVLYEDYLRLSRVADVSAINELDRMNEMAPPPLAPMGLCLRGT